MDYKSEHESFISGSNGTTAKEVVLLSFFTPIWKVTVTALMSKIQCGDTWKWYLNILEVFLLCVPLICGITFLNQHVTALFLGVLASAFLTVLLRRDMLQFNTIQIMPEFLSHYRSQLLLDTSISILAVDFPVYPRRLAKTELYGYGYMDVGVGCFVFAAGIISPEARCSFDPNSRWNNIRSALKSSALLGLLGIFRAVSIWLTNYHVQVTEYGVHWNFFLTLAAVRILCSCLLSAFGLKMSTLLVAICVAIYQWLLNQGGMTEFIMDNQRIGFFQQNKEGFLSLTGYCLLYLLAAHVGRIMFSSRSPRRMLIIVSAVAVICYYLQFASQDMIQSVSRRLMNVSYILWMVCFNCLQLVLHGTLHMVFPTKCSIYEAININGVLHFLIANLLTGAINFGVDTLHTSTVLALAVITFYHVCLSFIVLYLYKNNIKINLLRLKIKGS